MYTRKSNLMAVGGFYLLTLSPTAYCDQEQKNSVYGLSLEELLLVEVIVTVQKKEERLQKTPISVAVLSGEKLERIGLYDVAALQGSMPGVQFQPFGGNLLTIRGLGTFNLEPGVDSAVSYNVDGVYLSTVTSMQPLLFDLERVEVVRGPQGTLYGRNSNAGGINLVSKKPSKEFESSIKLQKGSYDLSAGEFVVNIPLSSSVSTRAALAAYQHEGYKVGGSGDADQYSARVRLLYDSSGTFSFLGTVDYSSQSGVGSGATTMCPSSSSDECSISWDPYQGQLNPNPDDFRDVSNLGLYAEARWLAGKVTLVSVSSYRDVESSLLRTTEDPSGGFFHFGPRQSKDTFLSQEFRLESSPSLAYQWVVGTYFSDESRTDKNDLLYEVPEVFVFSDLTYNLDDYDASSAAIFSQVVVPFSDWSRTTVGLRYTDENKSMEGTADNNATGKSIPIQTEDSDSGLTWKLGLEFDLKDEVLLYGSVSTGFKSGGANMLPADSENPETYQPEKITAYQLGIKSSFWNRHLRINSELFYYDYTGLQNIGTGSIEDIVFFYTDNTDKATYSGGEIEASLIINQNHSFGFAVTALNATYTSYILNGEDISGNTVRNSPPFTVQFVYDASVTLSNNATLSAHLQSMWFDEQWSNPNNSVNGLQREYTLSTVSATYTVGSGQWSVTVWGRNLEDEAVVFHTFADNATVNPPRTFGLSTKYSF